MKIFLKTIVVTIGLISITCNFALAEKYAPTPIVNELIEAMGEFEESYESNKWGEAKEATEEIETKAKAIIAQIKNDELEIVAAVENLKKAVDQKNSDYTELAFITLQRRFYSLLNDFDYEVHPVLSILDHYLDEAGEAAEKNDMDEVISEVRECGNLFKFAKPIFVEKGIAINDLNKCNSNMIALLMAGKHNDDKKVLEFLKEIQEQYETFMASVKS